MTAPLRAPAFLHSFVASCCRHALGWGGRGGRGGNSAVTNTSDLEQGIYDELQGTIDLVTPPKKRRGSSADSTISVAGSVWDAEPAKAAVLALHSRGLTKVDACT